MTQRITPSDLSLQILLRIQVRCGLPTLQSALDTLAALKGEQLLAQLEVIATTDPATFCELIAESQRSPATQPNLEEPPSLGSNL